MTHEKAKTLVSNLLKDKKLYRQMSKKEGEIWGGVFSDKKRKAAVEQDQKAAFTLRLNRNAIDLPELLDKHGIRPAHGLSLACGAGRAERKAMASGICQTFHGIDIAQDAIREAKRNAQEHHFDITYQRADLNLVSLKKDSYDLVMTQNCLHHILHLEHLADEIHGALRSNGVLWIDDYIGETQFQYHQERLDLVNRILEILPSSYHEDRVNERVVSKIVRRDPGTLISPFEAIRSEEIMPVFLKRFDILEKYESNSILRLVCPVGTRETFVTREDGRALFELIFLIDELMVKHGILKPTAGAYLLKPKPKP